MDAIHHMKIYLIHLNPNNIEYTEDDFVLPDQTSCAGRNNCLKGWGEGGDLVVYYANYITNMHAGH